MILIIPNIRSWSTLAHIPQSISVFPGVLRGDSFRLFHHKVRYLWSDEARRFRPAGVHFVSGQEAYKALHRRRSGWIQVGEMWISMKWRIFTPIVSVLFSFFSFVLVDGVRCDFVEGYIFFAFVHLFLVDVFFLGLQWVAWERTWNESFKCVWGKFGSVGSPQSFESLSRGMDTQNCQRVYFFHAFGNCEFQAFARIKSFWFIIQLLACTFFLLPRKLTWNMKIIRLKSKSFSKPPFLGSMLVFGGVIYK